MDISGLARRARLQGGAFTTADARGAEVGRGKLSSWVRSGLVRRLYRGVYASTMQPETWELRVAGAVLAAGRGAVVSHGSAAVLHGMFWLDPGDRRIELTVPHARRVEIPGVLVHRSVHLDEVDITRIGVLRVTSQARTLRDLAGSRPTWKLERAVDEAVADGAPVELIRTRLDECGPVPGRRRLRRILDRLDPSMAATRSEVERLALRWARTSEIPGLVAGHEVRDSAGDLRVFDLAIPHLRIGIEVDTVRHHGSTLARRRDGLRQNSIVLADWLILRFDLEDLQSDPDRITAEIEAAVSLQRAKGLGV